MDVNTKRILHVLIDNQCLVHGCCVNACPQVFELTDLTARLTADSANYYISHDAAIRVAVEDCPMGAIKIEEKAPN